MLKRVAFWMFFGLSISYIAHTQDVTSIIQQADSLSAEPEKALSLLNHAIDSTPNSEELLKVRAEIQSHLKLYGKAADDYRKLTAIEPADESYWYQLGRNLYEAAQYAEAIVAENHAVKLNAQYLPAYHVKIRALLKVNKPEEALKVSDATLKIGETAMNYFLQGEVNKRLNARQKAEWAYTKAIKIDKGFIDAYIALSDLAVGMNKVQEALEYADAALGINQDSEAAMIARSRGLALNSNLPDAIGDVDDVIRRNPDNVDAHYWRGHYLLESNKPQDAMKEFDWVSAREPANWRVQVGQADCFAAIGKKDAALAAYQKLLTEAPSLPDKDAIVSLANQRIFELKRENHAPQLALNGVAADNFDIRVPDNQPTLVLKGTISDESPVSKLIINGKEVPVKIEDGKMVFTASVATDVADVAMEVTDVYNNVNKLSYHLVKTETVKPEIALFSPKPDDKGSILVTENDGADLYIEGKVTDASYIADITVDGKPVDFDHDAQNPAFTSVVDISSKTHFSIMATDQNGNITEKVYRIEKTAVQAASTPQSPATPPTIERASN